jgi:hypothetical protein
MTVTSGRMELPPCDCYGGLCKRTVVDWGVADAPVQRPSINAFQHSMVFQNSDMAEEIFSARCYSCLIKEVLMAKRRLIWPLISSISERKWMQWLTGVLWTWASDPASKTARLTERELAALRAQGILEPDEGAHEFEKKIKEDARGALDAMGYKRVEGKDVTRPESESEGTLPP